MRGQEHALVDGLLPDTGRAVNFGRVMEIPARHKYLAACVIKDGQQPFAWMGGISAGNGIYANAVRLTGADKVIVRGYRICQGDCSDNVGAIKEAVCVAVRVFDGGQQSCAGKPGIILAFAAIVPCRPRMMLRYCRLSAYGGRDCPYRGPC